MCPLFCVVRSMRGDSAGFARTVRYGGGNYLPPSSLRNRNSTNGRRSLPKYMSSPLMKIVGEPKPPRAMSSSVFWRSKSL